MTDSTHDKTTQPTLDRVIIGICSASTIAGIILFVWADLRGQFWWALAACALGPGPWLLWGTLISLKSER